MKIEEVQEKFSALFPGLKVEFYKSKHGLFTGSPKSEQIASTQVLEELNAEMKQDNIQISPTMTVGSIENLFESKFGLHIQIFRRSNAVWLQTSETDDWTLEKQNTKGLHSIQKK